MDELKQVLRAAFGLSGTHLESIIGGRSHRLWRSGRWVVKWYDPRSLPLPRARASLDLQAHLAMQGLPVPALRRSRSGGIWADFGPGLVAVMAKAPGGTRQRGTLTPAEAKQLGTVLGQLHAAMRGGPGSEVPSPKPLLAPAIAAKWLHLRRPAALRQPATSFDRLVIEVADVMAAAVPRLPKVEWNEQPWQLCHGDFHLENVLFDDAGKITAVVDFDNATIGWRGVELMMAWSLCLCADPGMPELNMEGAAFFAAYCAAAGFPRQALVALPVAYAYWLAANTWPVTHWLRHPGAHQPGWDEILTLRRRAVTWLSDHHQEMAHWLLTAVPSESHQDP